MVPAAEMTVRLVQMEPRLGDVAANLDFHCAAAEQAVADGVSLVIFPELSLAGYYLRDLVPDVALPLTSPVLARLAALSERTDIVAGFVEEADDYSYYTAQAYFSAGRLHHVHRKVYLPNYGMFEEGRYFTAGRRIRSFDTRWGRVGLLVCEDLWHPSAPYILSQDGMHYLIACAASPGRGVGDTGLGTATTYGSMLRAYAELLQVHVLFCNRVGWEEGVSFWGGSRAVGPDGSLVACAPEFEAASVDAHLALGAVRRARIMAPLVADENLDLTLRELGRISRERAGD